MIGNTRTSLVAWLVNQEHVLISQRVPGLWHALCIVLPLRTVQKFHPVQNGSVELIHIQYSASCLSWELHWLSVHFQANSKCRHDVKSHNYRVRLFTGLPFSTRAYLVLLQVNSVAPAFQSTNLVCCNQIRLLFHSILCTCRSVRPIFCLPKGSQKTHFPYLFINVQLIFYTKHRVLLLAISKIWDMDKMNNQGLNLQSRWWKKHHHLLF